MGQLLGGATGQGLVSAPSGASKPSSIDQGAPRRRSRASHRLRPPASRTRVAVLELTGQRRDAAVPLGSGAVLPELCGHGVCEVDGRGTGGEPLHVTVGGTGEDPQRKMCMHLILSWTPEQRQTKPPLVVYIRKPWMASDDFIEDFKRLGVVPPIPGGDSLSDLPLCGVPQV